MARATSRFAIIFSRIDSSRSLPEYGLVIHEVVMAETVSLRVVGGVVNRTGWSARISSLELNCFVASSVGSVEE